MNKFKKAQSERVSSGKRIERASDLTTAGTSDLISQIEDNNETPLPSKFVEKHEEKEDIKKTQEDISPNKEEIELPVEPILDTSDATLSNPKDIVSSQPELIPQVTIPKPVASEIEATIPEQQVQPEITSEPVPVAQKNILKPEPAVIPVQEPTYKLENAPLQAEIPVVQPVEQTPVPIQTVISAATVQQTQVHTIPVAPQVQETVAMQMPAMSYPLMPEVVSVPVTRETTPKKSAPNIFHNKGESKSVRKSLVLKPTSVKIAENYCSKNGGSFNELIQHLLDNFIDEYGLR